MRPGEARSPGWAAGLAAPAAMGGGPAPAWRAPGPSWRRGGGAPRSALADLGRGIRQDPIEVLQAQAAGWAPELAALRHRRMLASAFAFSRGAVAIMAADLALAPSTGLIVQLCGDAHVCGFALAAGAAGRPAVALAAFDETLPGPFEWDVKRLVASLEVAARTRALPARATRRLVLTAAAGYRRAMRRVAGSGPGAGRAAAAAWPARRPAGPPPLWALDGGHPDAAGAMSALLAACRPSLPARQRRRLDRLGVAGVAPVTGRLEEAGPVAWDVLLARPDASESVVLRFKEARRSALEPYLGPSVHAHPGRRIAEGRRLLQPAGDDLLGWASGAGPDGAPRDFQLHQRAPATARPDVERLPAGRLATHAEHCGAALALAHARSSDPIAIAGYLGDGDAFDQAMAAFARAYADVVEHDHELLVHAAAAGMLDVAPAPS